MFAGVVNPKTGSSLGLELVKILGGGFDTTYQRTRVRFGDVYSTAVQVQSSAKLWARTPTGHLVDARGLPVPSATVDVVVEQVDAEGVILDSATIAGGFTYVRRYSESFDRVTMVLLDVLRSIFTGDVVLDQQADYSRDGVVLAAARLPALLVDGPNLVRDEFRSARPQVNYSAGNQVPRLIQPWARLVNYELVVTDTDRRVAMQAVGQLVRWLDSGPRLLVNGVEVEVMESIGSQFRAVGTAGQDYQADRVVAFHGGVDLVGVEVNPEAWDIAAEVQDPVLALGDADS